VGAVVALEDVRAAVVVAAAAAVVRLAVVVEDAAEDCAIPEFVAATTHPR